MANPVEMVARITVVDGPWAMLKKDGPIDTGETRKLMLTYNATIFDFLKGSGLLPRTFPGWDAMIEEAIVWLNDLTPEGQDFIMSKAQSNWLGACDRKSNEMGRKGVSREERLAVYRDNSGLYRRLEKFRKERRAKAN